MADIEYVEVAGVKLPYNRNADTYTDEAYFMLQDMLKEKTAILNGEGNITLSTSDTERLYEEIDQITVELQYCDYRESQIVAEMRSIEAIARFLDIETADIESSDSKGSADTRYFTPKGTFIVLGEKQLEPIHLQHTKELIEELGLEAFTPEFQTEIKKNYLDQAAFKEMAEEDVFILVEAYDKTELVDECVYYGLIDDEADMTEDGEYIGSADFSDLREELRERMEQEITKDFKGNYAAHYEGEHGREALSELVRTTPSIVDVQGISKRCVELDGYGHDFAPYDGKTHVQDGLYLFQQNEQDERSEYFKLGIVTGYVTTLEKDDIDALLTITPDKLQGVVDSPDEGEHRFDLLNREDIVEENGIDKLLSRSYHELDSLMQQWCSRYDFPYIKGESYKDFRDRISTDQFALFEDIALDVINHEGEPAVLTISIDFSFEKAEGVTTPDRQTIWGGQDVSTVYGIPLTAKEEKSVQAALQGYYNEKSEKKSPKPKQTEIERN